MKYITKEQKPMNARFKILIVSLLCLAVVLSACGPAATETAAPAETESPVATDAPTEAPTEAPAAPLTVLIDNDEGPITPANFNTFIGF